MFFDDPNPKGIQARQALMDGKVDVNGFTLL